MNRGRKWIGLTIVLILAPASTIAQDPDNSTHLFLTGEIGLDTGTNGNAGIANTPDVADNTGVVLAASDIGGDLDVTATTGTITDSGTVTVGGTVPQFDHR